ncbi:MAG: M23 family metallopeptidase [Nitriliruptorales bacterium]|nr:M23 family metallopeptidase [Nitriliruptorales bacterium]
MPRADETARHPLPVDRPVPPQGVAPVAVTPPPAPSRRRRLLLAALASGTLIAAPLAAQTEAIAAPLPATDHAATGLGPELRPVPPAPVPTATGADRERTALRPLARIDDLELLLPSPRTAMVGFHESFNAAAVELTPATTPEDDHGSKPLPDVSDDATAQAGIILPSRGRPGGATSAVDIAVPAGEPVLAPLSGEVVAVSPYFLYGKHPDVRIDVIPEGRPDLRVVFVHVSDVAVEPGDRIVAGETTIARSATALPFESQIDRFVRAATGATTPHVHIEVNQVSS